MERTEILDLLKDELYDMYTLESFDDKGYWIDEVGETEFGTNYELYAFFHVEGELAESYDAGDYFTPPSCSGEYTFRFRDVKVYDEDDNLIFEEKGEIPELTYSYDY